MLPKYFYSSEFKYFKEWSIIVVLIGIGAEIRSILLYSLLNIGTRLSLGSTGFVLPIDRPYDITQHMVKQLVKSSIASLVSYHYLKLSGRRSHASYPRTFRMRYTWLIINLGIVPVALEVILI